MANAVVAERLAGACGKTVPQAAAGRSTHRKRFVDDKCQEPKASGDQEVMTTQHSQPKSSPARGTYAWFESLSGHEKREYIEQYGCPPAKPGARSFTPGSLCGARSAGSRAARGFG